MSFSPLSQAGTTPYALVLVTISITIYEAALTPLLEAAICRQHYESLVAGKSRDLDCKSKPVQTTLALVGGNLQLVGALLGLLLALPYAWVVGRVSKQALLVLGAITTPMSMAYFFSICSRPHSFAIAAVYVTPVFNVFGGGPPLAFTLLYSLLASAINPDRLAASFYRVSSILLFVGFFSSAATARLLQVAPTSIPAIVVVTYAANLPLYLFIAGKTEDASTEDGLISRYDNAMSSDVDDELRVPLTGLLPSNSDSGELFGFLHDGLLKNRALRLCLVICFVQALAVNVSFVEVQWLSSRYNFTMPQATYLESYRLLICFIALTALPFATTPLLARLKSRQAMELRIMRLSVLARVVGAFGMAISPNLALLLLSISVAAMGAGADDSFKSLMTSICPRTDTTRLYLGTSIVEVVASVVSSQLWPRLLAMGYDLGLMGMAMPHMLSACLTASVYVLLSGLETNLPVADAETK